MAVITVLLGALVVSSTTSGQHAKKSEELYPTECGRRPLFAEADERTGFGSHEKLAKIVNGHDVSFGKYPWQVFIIVPNVTFCGGSLINSEWVLTAAHCMQEVNGSVILYFGERDVRRRNEALDSVKRSSTSIFIHPKYIAGMEVYGGYDLALLKLSESITFQPHIQPICLPTLQDMKNIKGKMAQATGWGDIYTDEGTSVLQEASLPILENKICREIYSDFLPPGKIDESTICAGYQHGKVAPCYGDSGGPLQMSRQDGSWFLVGVTSWGAQFCASYNAIEIYTRVSYHIPWIRRIMRYYRGQENF